MNVTRLLGLGLTPGKLRGLQRICNDNGTLTMVATDQNSSMINMMKDALKREPTYSEIVEAKIVLASALGKHASGLLVDGYYGIWNSVASYAIPKNVGVLVRVEQSGAGKNAVGAPLGAVEPGWGVGKIKRCGADAVKLLAQFEPTESESAEHQFNLVRQIHDECQKHDILFLLEPTAFPFGGEKKDSASYIQRKARTVIDSAKILSPWCDVYKAEFPGTTGVDSESTLLANLKDLNAASLKPWVLLSAGVDYPQYKTQVQQAVKCGASGVLGGRAFWKEFFLQAGEDARRKFANGEAANRVREIDEIVKNQATPWFQRYGLTWDDLHGMRAAEKWHFRYGTGGATGHKGSIGADDVY
jgi:tagatose 1,6-diphosphate aldolase